jgi:hypothetical protein
VSGKGDTQRPAQVSREEMERRWAKAFGKPEETPLAEVILQLFREAWVAESVWLRTAQLTRVESVGPVHFLAHRHQP